MKKIFLSITAGLSLISLSACKCTKSVQEKVEPIKKEKNFGLKYTQWKLDYFDWENRPFKANDEVKEIILSFGENSVDTNDGCNSKSGSFAQNGNKIEISSIMSTYRYCDREYMKQYGYMVPITLAASFSVSEDNGTLKLYNSEDKVIATYKREK